MKNNSKSEILTLDGKMKKLSEGLMIVSSTVTKRVLEIGEKLSKYPSEKGRINQNWVQ